MVHVKGFSLLMLFFCIGMKGASSSTSVSSRSLGYQGRHASIGVAGTLHTSEIKSELRIVKLQQLWRKKRADRRTAQLDACKKQARLQEPKAVGNVQTEGQEKELLVMGRPYDIGSSAKIMTLCHHPVLSVSQAGFGK